MHTVSFPGLGWTFELNPVAFSLFGLEVRWYGVIITIGIIAAFCYAYFRATKTERIHPDHLYNLALFTIPLGIVGARFIYVATKWEDYKGDFFKIIDIRSGGLAIYGAIIFGGATVITYCLVKKLSVWKVVDAVAPGVMLAQAIGRWGNFVNAEAYGSSANVGTLFCRMEIGGVCYHPTFLYESLWNLIGFALINLIFYRKKKFDGEIFFLYIGWYGFGRAWIELLRTDSLYIGPLKFSVVVGFLSFVASIIGLILLSAKHKKDDAEIKAGVEYTPKFARAAAAVEAEPVIPETADEPETEPAQTEEVPADSPADEQENGES